MKLPILLLVNTSNRLEGYVDYLHPYVSDSEADLFTLLRVESSPYSREVIAVDLSFVSVSPSW